VGRLLLEQCAEQIMRTSMELGGNAPFLVFADADLDAAVQGAMIAKMRNVGEACTAANRFYVHADVVDEFSRQLAEHMGALRIGRGSEQGVQVGPLIESTARKKVQHLVEDAAARGARVLVGGEPVGGPGYFYRPTVLVDVPTDAEIVSTEVFGPVAPITSFTDEQQVLSDANNTPFGLVSYVYTNDLRRALRVCERLETGMVGLNQGMVSNPAAPFGGIKHSGLGREGGTVGIEEFLETKYIAVAT
jgi:succinate-semialdehyde dehydrogenase/glutarate-semialdehyde dehydrogenase